MDDKGLQTLKRVFADNPEITLEEKDLTALLLDAFGLDNAISRAESLLSQGNTLQGLLGGRVQGESDSQIEYKLRVLAAAYDYAATNSVQPDKLKSIYDVQDYCVRLLGHSPYEKLVFVCLSNTNSVIGYRIFTLQKLDSVMLYPADLIRLAMSYQTGKVFIAHSHTCDSIAPSERDISFTKSLIRLLKGVNITLIEHLLVARDNCFSFYAENMLSE